MKHKLNTIELALFSVVGVIFLNSVYRLVTDGPALNRSYDEIKRKPASVTEEVFNKKDFLIYNTNCTSPELISTTASKVRIEGANCGAPSLLKSKRSPGSTTLNTENLEHPLSTSQVTNKISHFSGSLIFEPETNKFSTEFIPLELGKNNVHLDFKYKTGKSVPLDIEITREKK